MKRSTLRKISVWRRRKPIRSSCSSEEAINTLPEDNRAVLMLIVVEGYSYGEAAEMLGIPVGTVMSRLSRARHRLAEHMSGSNIVTLRRK